MPSKSAEEGGMSTRTTALTAGAVATGVGLVAIPFVGPILAGAAMWSYTDDANAAAKKQQEVNDKKRAECAAHYAKADRLKYSRARTRQMEIETGCNKQ